ncbi:hypothetical protein [Deinococcus navajonensis]|uniref:Uncharacterized protein n=1 Tax=Deinococcus navajonensis TaxID=309884 RepID=A0ABV8XTC2_9DEIO
MNQAALALTLSTVLWGGAASAAAPAAPACAPAQDEQAVRAAAVNMARSKLDMAAFFYRFQYNDVAYDVQVRDTEVRGDSATVRGLLTLRGTQRRDGKPISASFQGVVFLKRTAGCGWLATGYQQTGAQ